MVKTDLILELQVMVCFFSKMQDLFPVVLVCILLLCFFDAIHISYLPLLCWDILCLGSQSPSSKESRNLIEGDLLIIIPFMPFTIL